MIHYITLQRSSWVRGGAPSRAVFNASTGLFLKFKQSIEKTESDWIQQKNYMQIQRRFCYDYFLKNRLSYCLSKLSILRDLCSILVKIASAFSASTKSAIFLPIRRIQLRTVLFWGISPGQISHCTWPTRLPTHVY